MPSFVLTFPYRGHTPGDVIEVDDADVGGLVEAGIGHPQESGVKLALGRLPKVVPLPRPGEEEEPKVQVGKARRTKKATESADN